MRLSIIIPVYQVAGTLKRCVDSVVNQSFRDWQMILVDDASDDGSGRLCDDYAHDNPRIKVLHLRKNGGLSAARNAGIDKARGEYITFIDSDDYIAPDTLKVLMEELAIHPDYDMLEYPVYEHFGSKEQRMMRLARREYSNMQEYWLEGKAYSHTYAWNKIYRHEVFRGIRFPEGKTFEDVPTLSRVLARCGLVATTDVGLYYYCDNPHGITRNASAVDLNYLLQSHLEIISRLYPAPSHRSFPKRLDTAFGDYYAHVLNILLDCTDMAPSCTLPFQGKDKFPILPYRHTLKLRLLHLLGLKRLCQLHRIFRKIHKPRR